LQVYIKLARYKHRDETAKQVKMSSIPNWTGLTRGLKEEGTSSDDDCV
jgi:hypothetical protein